MTVLQKRLKSLTLSYLDKLVGFVAKLKEAGAHTNLDQALRAQRLRVNQTQDPKVLLQVTEGETLARYLARVDALEESLREDDETNDASIVEDREGDALDAYLEKIGQAIDAAREAVTEEIGEHVTASGNDFLDTVAAHLEATGAVVSLVTALFKRKSLSELMAARKKRKRWLRTPGGKAALRRAKIRAKRPHTIDRQRSKTSKLAHHVYKY